MNTTEFALKLIQDYNTEQNRYRRARAAVHRLQVDTEWHDAAIAVGVASYYNKTAGWSPKAAKNTFLDRSTNRPTDKLFVSSGVKSARICSLSKTLTWQMEKNFLPSRIAETEAELAAAKKAPVNAELGKKWRQLVSAQVTSDQAYESRWKTRCAIVAFNKMQPEIKIKFGNCDEGGGSMSTINHVVIDGFKIKLRKFLDNALFETVILNG